MLNQVQIAAGASNASMPIGTTAVARGGQLGDQIVTELQPRYYEQTYRKNLFGAYFAPGAVSLSQTVAATGLALYNGSTVVNMVLTKVSGYILATSSTTTGLVLASATVVPSSTTVADRVGNNFLGGVAPAGSAFKAYTYATAPVALFPLMHNTAAINTVGEDQGFLIDFEGSIIIPPGQSVVVCALGAASASSSTVLGAQWIEVPI